jgi:putative Holliday junction resolvase
MKSGTVMALDFGAKRIGVAVGESSRGIAHPLAAITYEDNARRLQALGALIAEWQPVELVLGIPQQKGDPEHPLAQRIRRFARRIQTQFNMPVELVDEHLTSWSASRRLSEAGIAAKQQRQHIDAMAACAILETWFEMRKRGAILPSAGME